MYNIDDIQRITDMANQELTRIYKENFPMVVRHELSPGEVRQVLKAAETLSPSELED